MEEEEKDQVTDTTTMERVQSTPDKFDFHPGLVCSTDAFRPRTISSPSQLPSVYVHGPNGCDSTDTNDSDFVIGRRNSDTDG